MSPKLFMEHVKTCPPQQENKFSLHQQLIPLNIEIVSADVKSNDDENYEYSEYELNVSYRGISYQITKKINLFIGLFDSLDQHFPGLQMPPLPDIFNASDEERGQMKEDGMYSMDYSESLQNLLNCFTLNPVVRESVFFKKFMEMDKQFPDEFASQRNRSKYGPYASRTTMMIMNSKSSFDLMPDGYVNNSVFSPKVSLHNVQAHYNTYSPNTGEFDTDDDEAIIIDKKLREDLLE